MTNAQFAVSGQHYLFNVQTFASIVLSNGGDEYDYALRDRTTHGVIDDVASGKSELGVLVETTRTRDELVEILERPASNIYVVRGEEEHLIPAVPAFILHTDPENGIVTVRLIEGM